MTKHEVKQATGEVDVLKKLDHPNIVAYRDAGGDLGSAVQQRAKAKRHYTEPEILRILAQSIDALAHCHHELYLLHRDLKPENIFLTADGDVKVGDFGVSKLMGGTAA